MSAPLSANTQAILLLTAPLIVGRGVRGETPLTGKEYGRLAAHLRDNQLEPADFLSHDALPLIQECAAGAGVDRLQKLLERGLQLSQAIERWNSRSIWVTSRADSSYPRRIKARLNGAAPPILYGCGSPGLLETGGLAIVGSRDVDDNLKAYAEAVGELAARAERTVISGGARGIDRMAMLGALEGGGRSVGILADDMEQTVVQRENRDFLRGGRLTLVSPFDPAAGFNVGHAMSRNKLIYALADAALVVSSDVNKGGTWSGAIEQLDKLHFVPVYVRSTGPESAGLEALKRRGARVWPNPSDAEALSSLIESPPQREAEPAQVELSLARGIAEPTAQAAYATQSNEVAERGDPPTVTNASAPAEELFDAVRSSLRQILCEPKTEAAVADVLGIHKTQAREWLHRLVTEGVIERRGKRGLYANALRERTIFDREGV